MCEKRSIVQTLKLQPPNKFAFIARPFRLGTHRQARNNFHQEKRPLAFHQFSNVWEPSSYNAGLAPGACIGCVLAPGVNNSLVCCCIFISLSISKYCCSSAYANAHGTPSSNALVPITHNALPPHDKPVPA